MHPVPFACAAVRVAVLAAGLAAPAAASAAVDPAAADAAARAFVAQHGIPAAHVTVLQGDRVVLQRGYGSGAQAPDAGTAFPLGSISKQFTAAAILALADAGRLRLDAPVGEYLPEWFADQPALRVSHLLEQTSGLADFLWLDGYRALADDADTPIAAYVALGAAAPRRFAPGTRWAYSNTNYKALALIAERVDGRPFDELLRERVLEPAGVAGIASCHALGAEAFLRGVAADGEPKPLDASAAAYTGDGGLCGNAAALAGWIRRALAPSAGAAARLARTTSLADGTVVPYGFGLSTREFLGQAMRWHGGNVDSHSTLVAYLPGADLGVVILASRGFVWLTELLPALIGTAPPAVAAAPPGPPAAARVRAPLPSGLFEDGLFRFELTATDGGARVAIDLLGEFEFVAAGDREWIAKDLPATLRIRLPPDGSRDRFEFDWGELRSYAQRVATGPP